MEIGRELIEKIFLDTNIDLRVGSRLHTSEETILNYLVLARSVENDQTTVRWDGAVRVSPRMTIAADEHASINLREFYGSDEVVPPQLRDMAIVFRSAYLHLETGVQRQHIPQRLEEAISQIKNIFDRITSHRSRSLGNENNALIIAPSEFVWPVSVLKYVSEVVGQDFRSFLRYSP
ncbi:MAG TPA: hypothetical protein VJ417_01230 [Candidatus Glassbacteria bacterium]|nr:hypothetical protein [Candidatus Glassbacteria bacterium]